MRRVFSLILLLVIGMAVAYTQVPQESKETSLKPKDGFVPNAATAVKIGEAVLIPICGQKKLDHERPFKATRFGNAWRVTGTINCGAPVCAGGTAVVKIGKTSGEILFVGHYE